MVSVKLKCVFCGKEFLRSTGRANEARKFGWKPYCSLACQYKARTKQEERKCGNLNCNITFLRRRDQLKKSKSNLSFCSTRCAAIFNNGFRRKMKNCPVCGANFYGDKVTCSRGCWINLLKLRPKVEKIPKKEIIDKIQKFYHQNGRIPEKRECSYYNTARDKFGSWNKAVELAGFYPNPEKFSNKHIANDGHKCNSLAERIIDDWLNENNIEHEREVFYPGSRSLRVDFIANGIWIEFFGLAGELKDYDRTMKQKFALINQHKIPFLALYPKDLFPVNKLDTIISFKDNQKDGKYRLFV